jgi:gamma-glutamylcyclotransferase (GGCT)/AIG2-like uncharacterized protein YtfP
VSEPARERIFLYGTLRRGGSRDVLKFYEGAFFAGGARLRGTLYDLGEYPGLILDDRADFVIGELFDVTAGALADLDEWEGIDLENPDGGEYRRRRIEAELADGSPQPCWVYEIRPEVCAGRPVIGSGDWLSR